MLDLAALASARGLTRCARRLSQFTIGDAQPSIDPLPRETIDAPTALGLMRRRGLEPALVRPLLVWLERRPLELGLFSWDVLCSALLDGSDASLLSELRANALRSRPLLPAPGSTFAHFTDLSSGKAVEELARPGFRNAGDDSLSYAATVERSLGALDELRQRHGLEVLQEGGTPASTVEFARLLHLSHLPTLATLYADYALNVLGERSALPVLVEILLDVGASQSLPPPSLISPEGTRDQLDLLGYAAARTAIVTGQGKAVFQELDAKMKNVYAAPDIEQILAEPRSHVVYADAAAEQNQISVPFPILDHIVQATAEWRYGHRVRAVVAGLATETPSELPVLWVDRFVEQFGNEFTLWYEANVVATGQPWRAKLPGRVAAEVLGLPHDFMAWTGLATMLDDGGTALVGEINERAATQCELTIAN